MPRLNNEFVMSNITDVGQLGRFVSIFSQDIYALVNGNIELDLNLKANLVSVNFNPINFDTNITHTLGRKPKGYIITSLSGTGVLYDGSGGKEDWTDKTIVIRSTAVITAGILIF